MTECNEVFSCHWPCKYVATIRYFRECFCLHHQAWDVMSDMTAHCIYTLNRLIEPRVLVCKQIHCSHWLTHGQEYSIQLVMGKKYGQAVTSTLMMEAETIFETQDYNYIVYMVDWLSRLHWKLRVPQGTEIYTIYNTTRKEQSYIYSYCR